jgi:hypothetical protein
VPTLSPARVVLLLVIGLSVAMIVAVPVDSLILSFLKNTLIILYFIKFLGTTDAGVPSPQKLAGEQFGSRYHHCNIYNICTNILTHTIFGTTIAKHITFIKTIVKIIVFFLGTKNFFEVP